MSSTKGASFETILSRRKINRDKMESEEETMVVQDHNKLHTRQEERGGRDVKIWDRVNLGYFGG